MSKLSSVLALAGIAVLASSSAVFAANPTPSVAPLSLAAQEAYADQTLSNAAASTSTAPAPLKAAPVAVGGAAQWAYAGEMLSIAAANTAADPMPVQSTNAAVSPVGSAAQEGYADQILAKASARSGDSSSTQFAAHTPSHALPSQMTLRF